MSTKLCSCCGERKESKLPGDFWYLNGHMDKFWGCWCRECFHDISQTPNHEIIDQSRFNKALVKYEIRKSKTALI